MLLLVAAALPATASAQTSDGWRTLPDGRRALALRSAPPSWLTPELVARARKGPTPAPASAAPIYGTIRATLETRGQTIGPNDLWIAAHAKALDLTLVTNNEREFQRIDGLKIENWMNV